MLGCRIRASTGSGIMFARKVSRKMLFSHFDMSGKVAEQRLVGKCLFDNLQMLRYFWDGHCFADSD